jgi:diaminohydroxyphosphoribosylaminopyrimidine deaminase/5-amino-6-(5-phosphoribosylamino)uracil reductase
LAYEPRAPRQPRPVVIDPELALPLDAPLVAQRAAELIVVAAEGAEETRAAALRDRGVAVLQLPVTREIIDVEAILRALGEQGLQWVLVEGGGDVLGRFLDAAAVDEVIAFIAPKLVGGRAAISPVGGGGVAEMGEALRLRSVEIATLGGDVRVRGALGDWRW